MKTDRQKVAVESFKEVAADLADHFCQSKFTELLQSMSVNGVRELWLDLESLTKLKWLALHILDDIRRYDTACIVGTDTSFSGRKFTITFGFCQIT